MRPLIKTADEGAAASAWGRTPLAPSVVDTPTTPEAQAATVATQAANEADRAAIALSQLAPPPFGVPMVDEGGTITRAWVSWISQLYRRSGSSIVTPASDMDVLTEFDDIPMPIRDLPTYEWAEPSPRPAPEVLDWLGSLEPQAQIAMLAQQVDVLTALVLSIRERGWNPQAALTTAAAAAPAGGVGTAAGGWDTAVNRDAAITTLNNLRTRVNEIESRLQFLRIL